MFKNGKIIILGGGVGQLPLIEIAKKNDKKIIVISPKGSWPGISFADKVYYEDVRNTEKILKIAAIEKVDYIISDQIDVAVPTMAIVSEKLKLKGIGFECALKFSDKNEMKKCAQKCGVSTVHPKSRTGWLYNQPVPYFLRVAAR